MNATADSSYSILDCLDETINLYRKHFIMFFGIAVLLQIPTIILDLLLQHTFSNPALVNIIDLSSPSSMSQSVQNLSLTLLYNALTLLVTMLVGVAIQSFIIQSLLTGALINATACSRTGQPPTILGAYRLNLWTFLSLIVATIATMVITILLSLLLTGCWVVIGLGLLDTLSDNTMLAVAISWLSIGGAFIVLIISTAFFFLCFQLVPQVIVLEGQGPLRSLYRSWQLVRRSFKRVFTLILIMTITSLTISALPGAWLNAANGTLFLNSANWEPFQVITSLVSAIGYTLWIPLQAIAYTLLYYDLATDNTSRSEESSVPVVHA